MNNWLSKFAAKFTDNWILKNLIECIIIFPIFFVASLLANFSEPHIFIHSLFLSLICCTVAFLVTTVYSLIRKK
ncbi:hypothetical protein GCM10019998_05850 [Tetragenococcus solitarius]|uniref:Uncharacterized protein n=1 Tax=Tetragenococcus solitarius TaxID=71453 RepID=A0ABN3Y0V0_9ENTE